MLEMVFILSLLLKSALCRGNVGRAITIKAALNFGRHFRKTDNIIPKAHLYSLAAKVFIRCVT